jgi:hypothetical protein
MIISYLWTCTTTAVEELVRRMRTVATALKFLLIFQYCWGASVIKDAMGWKCRTLRETTDRRNPGHKTQTKKIA